MRFKRFQESSNPIMKDEAYRKSAYERETVPSMGIENRMTISGAVNKTFILAGIMLMTTIVGFVMYNPMMWIIGAIGGLVMLIWATFKPQLSPYLAPAYAAFEGLFVGAISMKYAYALGMGVIFQAVSLTLAILFTMLFVYKMELIKVTDKFRSIIIMATGGIFLVYILNFALSFFGINIPYLHEGGMIGIGISLFIIGIASLNLLLDFDNFEKGERYGAAKYMEWFSAMGLLVTLVWIYVEVLRLVAILSSSD